MKEFIQNNGRSLMYLLLVILCLTGSLVACTPEEPEEQQVEKNIATPAQSEAGDWQVPGLVDRSGKPIEVPTPGPSTGKKLNVTDFGADLNADSGDDAAAIRAALEAAEPGDEVVLPAGTYDLRSTDPKDNSANIVLRSGVHLRGEGQERTVLVTSLDGEENSRVICGSGIHDVIVADFTITSRHTGPLGEDTKDGNAGGGPMYGIYIGVHEGEGSAQVLVENIGIRKFERHGISVKGSREVTLSGNHISEATAVGPGGKGYGIAIEGLKERRDSNAGNDSRHNVAIGNTFEGKHLRHAILLQFSTHNNLVAENIIVGSLLDAIDLHGEGEYLNEIRNNTVIGGHKAGIALGNSGGKKNKHDASGSGNWVHDNHLIGNRQGILVILGTPNTVIEENRITAGVDSEAGIELRNAPGTELKGNYITGGNEGFWAIRLNEDRGTEGRGTGIPSNIKITSNVIRQVANGIRIDAGENLRMTQNVIEDINGSELKAAEGVKVIQSERE